VNRLFTIGCELVTHRRLIISGGVFPARPHVRLTFALRPVCDDTCAHGTCNGSGLSNVHVIHRARSKGDLGIEMTLRRALLSCSCPAEAVGGLAERDFMYQSGAHCLFTDQ